ncbi:MAG: polysaccharide deacetylase family protein [Actinomycetota bacterium]
MPARRGIDAEGGLLFAGAAVWTGVAAVASGGNPYPALALLVVAAVLVFGVGRAVDPRIVLAVVVGVAAALTIPVLARLVARGRPGLAPLGYPNANAAFFLQAAVGAIMLLVMDRRSSFRWAAALSAAGFVALVVFGTSRAAAVLLLLPAVAVVVGRRPALVRAVVALAMATFLFALWAVAVVASDLGRGERTAAVEAADRAFDHRRLALWTEADALMVANPVAGVGPQRFQAMSPTARSDPDARWAHNDFLQQGAETGVPGFTLLVLLFLWALARLWDAAERGLPVALAASAVGALGAHATMDHLLSTPLVPIVAAGLVGASLGATERREFRPGPLLRKGLKTVALAGGVGAARKAGDVSILLFHRVGAGDREVDLQGEAFDAMMADIARRERVLTLDEALEDGSDGGVVITFDDGYRDFHEVALPVLVRRRVPAVLYLATGLVGDPELGRDALGWPELEEAVATGLVTVGSHTHSHVHLGGASPAVAEREMRRSKELVEDRLGVACRHFAYPFAVGSPVADAAARKLFASAALGWGTNRSGRIDRYRLQRTPVLRSDGMFFFRAKVKGLLDGEAAVYRAFGRGPWRVR